MLKAVLIILCLAAIIIIGLPMAKKYQADKKQREYDQIQRDFGKDPFDITVEDVEKYQNEP